MIEKAANQKEKINSILTLNNAYWQNSFHLSIGRNQWKSHPKIDQHVSLLDLNKDVMFKDIKQEIFATNGQE